MDVLERSERRTAPLGRLELLGYSIVAIGFGLVILGILEIGGLFNIWLGLAAVESGSLMIFGGEDADAIDQEAFRRQLDRL